MRRALHYLAWAVLGFTVVSGCAGLAPGVDAGKSVDKLATAQKVAMLVCAEYEARARGVSPEQAFVEFCAAEEQIRPWVARLTECTSPGAGGNAGESSAGGTGGGAGQ